MHICIIIQIDNNSQDGDMKKILILGTGCMKCEKLYEMVNQAVRELGVEYEVEKITDLNKITEYGIALTPALVVDGEVKLAGKLPTNVEEIKRYIQ